MNRVWYITGKHEDGNNRFYFCVNPQNAKEKKLLHEYEVAAHILAGFEFYTAREVEKGERKSFERGALVDIVLRTKAGDPDKEDNLSDVVTAKPSFLDFGTDIHYAPDRIEGIRNLLFVRFATP